MNIRALVVDDSAFMRKAISMMLESDPAITVIDTCRDGREAIEKAKRLRPDLITMDVDMPRLDGISAVRAIMQERPCPILMISSMTKDGAQSTLDALEAGAVDFIPKDLAHVSLEITKIQAELIQKVKVLATSRRSSMLRTPRVSAAPQRPTPLSEPLSATFPGVVVIAVSTGGPAALQELIPALPSTFPVPILIVQHMPPHFTRSLADRLNNAGALYVVEARSGMQLAPGTVLVAPGGRQMVARRSVLGVTVEITDSPADALYKPSADVTLFSAVESYGSGVVGVIMTGMGHDGREGAAAVKKAGGSILVQSPETCVVDGMPRSVIDRNLADGVASVEAIAGMLMQVRTAAVPATGAA